MDNRPRKRSGDRSAPASAGEYLGHGLTWAASTLLFLWLGTKADAWLNTDPWLALVGAFVGAGAGFYHMYHHLVVAPRERDRERREQMVSWFAYAAASAALLVGLVVGVGALVESADPAALVLAAVVAWVVQVLAYAALVAGRKRGEDFLVSWAAGMLLRFAVVAGVAFFVTRSSELDAATALVGLVGFVMVLVLLEPLFLRRAD